MDLQVFEDVSEYHAIRRRPRRGNRRVRIRARHVVEVRAGTRRRSCIDLDAANLERLPLLFETTTERAIAAPDVYDRARILRYETSHLRTKRVVGFLQIH